MMQKLGEKLIEICLLILGKAVKLTKTSADDELYDKVAEAIKALAQSNLLYK